VHAAAARSIGDASGSSSWGVDQTVEFMVIGFEVRVFIPCSIVHLQQQLFRITFSYHRHQPCTPRPPARVCFTYSCSLDAEVSTVSVSAFVAGVCGLSPPSPPPDIQRSLAHAMGTGVVVEFVSGSGSGSLAAHCRVGGVCLFELRIPFEADANAVCGAAAAGASDGGSDSGAGMEHGAHIVAQLAGDNSIVQCRVSFERISASSSHLSAPSLYTISCAPHDPGQYRLQATVVYISGSDIDPPPTSHHHLPIFVGYNDVPSPPFINVEEEEEQQQQQQPLCFSPSSSQVTDSMAYMGRWVSRSRCNQCNCSHVHSQVPASFARCCLACVMPC
jgi:hypothetical protein